MYIYIYILYIYRLIIISDLIINNKLFTTNIQIQNTHIRIKLDSGILQCKSSKPVQNYILKKSARMPEHGLLNRKIRDEWPPYLIPYDSAAIAVHAR